MIRTGSRLGSPASGCLRCNPGSFHSLQIRSQLLVRGRLRSTLPAGPPRSFASGCRTISCRAVSAVPSQACFCGPDRDLRMEMLAILPHFLREFWRSHVARCEDRILAVPAFLSTAAASQRICPAHLLSALLHLDGVDRFLPRPRFHCHCACPPCCFYGRTQSQRTRPAAPAGQAAASELYEVQALGQTNSLGTICAA